MGYPATPHQSPTSADRECVRYPRPSRAPVMAVAATTQIHVGRLLETIWRGPWGSTVKGNQMSRLERAIRSRLEELGEADLYPAGQQQVGSNPILQLRLAASLGAGAYGEELLEMFFEDLDSSNVELVADDEQGS